jgi:mRNA interferase MazF
MPRRNLSEPTRSFELRRPPRRGEIYWVAFGVAAGGEIRKTRPAVVVSNDSANTALNRLQVVPLTSQTARVYPSEALVTLRGEKRKAMADQLTTASRSRLVGYLGRLGAADMEQVDRAIRLQLALT